MRQLVPRWVRTRSPVRASSAQMQVSIWQSVLLTTLVTSTFNVGGIVLESVLSPEPAPESSGCSVLIRDVKEAVDSGVDDPAILKSLERPDCSMDPIDVAEDIQD